MIGVISKEEEKGVVKEFFQLFKTPWEFCVAEKSYDIVISTSRDLPIVTAKILILYSSEVIKSDLTQDVPIDSRCKNLCLQFNSHVLPIYGHVLMFKKNARSLLRVNNNSKVIGVEIDGLKRKVLRIGYDLFGEVALLLSKGQPIENAHIPTLDIHIGILRKLIVYAGIPVAEIQPVPAGYSFIVCLTHDVDFIKLSNHWFDHTMFGFLYRAIVGSLLDVMRRRIPLKRLLTNWKAVLSLPLIYLGYWKDFWLQFEKYLEIERGLGSTFFFIPFKHRAGDNVQAPKPERRAAKYDIQDVKYWIEALLANGHEIGVHGIDGWHDSGKGHQERDQILRVTGVEALGIRMHWLLFRSDSPKLLEEAGYLYDSTFGYNETVGFRAGTTQVFRPMGAKRLIEIPVNIQDVAMFYPSFLNLSEEEAWERCHKIIKQMLEYGGVLTVLWHMRSLAPERLWGDFYVRLLKNLKENSVWFATATQVAEWFRLRRSVSFKNFSVSENKLRLCLESTQEINNANFVLRVYKPLPHSSSPLEHTVAYIDIPWTGEENITIPLYGAENDRIIERKKN